MVFIGNGKKLHVSAHRGHLQVLITFLLKRVLHNTPNPRGDIEISSSTKARKMMMRSQHHHAVQAYYTKLF
jgi:hypothetical protein